VIGAAVGEDDEAEQPRGTLRVYLGAAPGVGKTYAMLGEGHRRLARGTDLAVGFVEAHGRAHIADLIEGLEVVPRRQLSYGGSRWEEMDVDAVLARRPAVALVDELAHTNVPGSRNAKRWQDVEELLAAGINVISTLNVQHLESLADVVESITGVGQRERIPDEVVRRADQIELVDMTAEALRRRLAHGNVYPPQKVDAALSNLFRAGNLTALRELALLWLADRVDDALERYRSEHEIHEVWPARERVVVGLSGGAEGETVIRRAARIAGRTAGGELLAVHVARGDGLIGATPQVLAGQRALVESLGGTFHTVVGDRVATALLDFARGANATQVVLGVSRRSRLASALQEGVGDEVTRLSGPIDVHLVSHEHAGGALRARQLARVGRGLSRRRVVSGWVLGLLGLVAVTAALRPFRDEIELSTPLMIYISLTVAVALVGGLGPAIATALFSGLLLNWYFTPPVGTFSIGDPENAFALAAFVAVAAAVASVVDRSATRAVRAARLGREAEALSLLAGSVLRGEDTVAAVLGRLRETFGMSAVTLLERDGDTGWRMVATSGAPPCRAPDDADESITVSPELAVCLRGRRLPAQDRRVLEAFAAQAAVVLERERLREQAGYATDLEHANAIRTALLAAVSHDLRTPLASIKAAVSSLRAPDVTFTGEDEAELLATIETGADRLERLIDNLLDASRLQSGVLRPQLRRVDLDEVVPRAVEGVPAGLVRMDVDERLPLVLADPGLLERIVANLVENAVRHGGAPVLVTASARPGVVELRVIDRGPGVPAVGRERMFGAFQRLGDTASGAGVGLGLTVARGFAEALGGTLEAEDTPGGGLTMVLTLPVAAAAVPAAAERA
jgi:two-component system sensor histidine kinase KdpD